MFTSVKNTENLYTAICFYKIQLYDRYYCFLILIKSHHIIINPNNKTHKHQITIPTVASANSSTIKNKSSTATWKIIINDTHLNKSAKCPCKLTPPAHKCAYKSKVTLKMVRITNTPRGNACFHYYNRASRPWSGVRFNHQRETTLLCFELPEREITQTLVRWSNTSDKNSIIIIIPQHMKVSIQNVTRVFHKQQC